MKIIFKDARKDVGIKDALKDVVRIIFTDKAKGTTCLVREGGITSLEMGVGKPEEMNVRKFIMLCRAIIRTAKANKCKKIAIMSCDFVQHTFKNLGDATPAYLAQLAAENFEMANFECNAFKTISEDGPAFVEEILFMVSNVEPFDTSSSEIPEIKAAIKKGQEIGKAVNACRLLSNTPGADMTPSLLAKAARDAVRGLSVKVTTLGEKEMKKLGMGAVLGVAKGSTEKPEFIIMEYNGGGKKSAPVVLVGKGVTFDSGGLNLKSSSGMYEMHMDMSGGAAVIHTIALAARLGLKKNIIGLVPAVENMPGNNAYRPGDILKSLSGKTIEVVDTDAEGRLILADALTYAKRFKPAVVIDIATLTGAALSALGLHASALLTRDDALAKDIARLAEESGDYVWPLPMWDEYEETIKSTFADMANVPTGPNSRYGGATNGGMFLWQFAKELNCPWAHLDIAPRMTSAHSDGLCKGAAGAPIRLLVRFIEQYVVQ